MINQIKKINDFVFAYYSIKECKVNFTSSLDIPDLKVFN